MQGGELYGDDGSPFEGWSLDIVANMEDPPAEAFETSYLRARELLEDAGANSAILLLTVTEDGEDLASKVVLSSGYQRIPTHLVLSILDTHLEALGEGGEG